MICTTDGQYIHVKDGHPDGDDTWIEASSDAFGPALLIHIITGIDGLLVDVWPQPWKQGVAPVAKLFVPWEAV